MNQLIEELRAKVLYHRSMTHDLEAAITLMEAIQEREESGSQAAPPLVAEPAVKAKPATAKTAGTMTRQAAGAKGWTPERRARQSQMMRERQAKKKAEALPEKPAQPAPNGAGAIQPPRLGQIVTSNRPGKTMAEKLANNPF